MNYDYAKWPRRKLIEHVTAYAEGLRTLGSRCMKQEHELRRLRPMRERLQAQEIFRKLFR